MSSPTPNTHVLNDVRDVLRSQVAAALVGPDKRLALVCANALTLFQHELGHHAVCRRPGSDGLCLEGLEPLEVRDFDDLRAQLSRTPRGLEDPILYGAIRRWVEGHVHRIDPDYTDGRWP